MANNGYLTTKQASDYLKLSVSQLYKLTSKKSIPYFALTGKKIVFRAEDLDAWVESHRVDSKAELEAKAQAAAAGV